MGRRVADDVPTFFGRLGDDLDGPVRRQRTGDVEECPVVTDRDCCLAEPGPDAPGHLGTRHAVGVLVNGPIRKCQPHRHGLSSNCERNSVLRIRREPPSSWENDGYIKRECHEWWIQ